MPPLIWSPNSGGDASSRRAGRQLRMTSSAHSGGHAMQQIENWLESLGLGEYSQRFAENRIDASVLRDLTEEDLEKIGIRLGHRKKMLRAIAELGGAELTRPQAVSGPKIGRAHV